MNGVAKELEKRRGGIDPAALAAAALAAAISSIAPPGPYGPVSMIIGATILFLIFAYDIDPHRTPYQSLAFSAVAGLIAVLALGYPSECIFATHRMVRLRVLLKEIDPDVPQSEVPPIVTILLWLLLTVVLYLCDRRNLKKAVR